MLSITSSLQLRCSSGSNGQATSCSTGSGADREARFPIVLKCRCWIDLKGAETRARREERLKPTFPYFELHGNRSWAAGRQTSSFEKSCACFLHFECALWQKDKEVSASLLTRACNQEARHNLSRERVEAQPNCSAPNQPLFRSILTILTNILLRAFLTSISTRSTDEQRSSLQHVATRSGSEIFARSFISIQSTSRFLRLGCLIGTFASRNCHYGAHHITKRRLVR